LEEKAWGLEHVADMTVAYFECKKAVMGAYDYGAGGGNFIGVSVGVAAAREGISDARGDSDGDSVAVGSGEVATVGEACVDDVGDAWDGLEGRRLEKRLSGSRATTIAITAAMPPTLAQNSVFWPRLWLSL